MVTAQTAWELGRASKGRFSLGLGSQVKAHIERRFSTPFEHPGPKLREYVLAVRAIWRAFQGEEKLAFDGDFYQFSLLTDFFSPGPSDFPDIPVSIAGVNTGMARLAGEVCDGFHVHPFHSRRYLAEIIRPAIAKRRRIDGTRGLRMRGLLPGVRHRRRHATRSRPRTVKRSDASCPSTARPARTARSSSSTGGRTPASSCTASWPKRRHRRDGRASSPTRCSTSTRSHRPGTIWRRRCSTATGASRTASSATGRRRRGSTRPQLAERWQAVAAAVRQAS